MAALTGLRAVACLMVLVSHAFFWTGNYTDDAFGRFGARLEVSVPFFFALSGYLLIRPWVRTGLAGATAAKGPSLIRYLRARARRILPAYWAVVVLVYAVYLLRDSGPFGRGWDGFLRNMTFTQIYGYGHLHDSLTQLWSIAVEVSFYLVLPLIGLAVARALRSRGGTARALLALAAVAALSPLWIWATHTDLFYRLPGLAAARVDLTAQLWLPSFLIWFAAGMMLAVAEPALRRRGFPRRPRLFTAACLAVSAATFAVACTPIAGEGTIMPVGTGESIAKNLLYTACTLGVLAPLTLARGCARPTLFARALAWRPVVWLGGISYEFYLLHLLVMELLMDALGYRPFHGSVSVLAEATVVVTIPLAWLLARLTQPRGARRSAPHDDAPAAGSAGPHAPGQPRQRPVAENSSSTASASESPRP
ncbi:acyltransferase family protein [Tomitella cavernea]|uniref:Acyltransferase n=1 Tax=Tomitella cavernea TaxID=1387982 RepID=A0ABP9C8C2_9ACTN|nr:acyltransferase [Tomitella cavernea]